VGSTFIENTFIKGGFKGDKSDAGHDQAAQCHSCRRCCKPYRYLGGLAMALQFEKLNCPMKTKD
jgi:hypothetical protein